MASNQFPDINELASFYLRMQVIRKAEEQLLLDVRQGRAPGQVHLSDGQEAIAVKDLEDGHPNSFGTGIFGGDKQTPVLLLDAAATL